MGTGYLFTHLNIVALDPRASWKEGNMGKARVWMAWFIDDSSIGSGSGFGIFRSSPRKMHCRKPYVLLYSVSSSGFCYWLVIVEVSRRRSTGKS